MSAKQPMLAPSKPITHEQALASGIKWLVQPKYDGIRVTFWDGHPYTRSGKEIPNVQIRKGLIEQFNTCFLVSQAVDFGLDGELLVFNKHGKCLTFNQIQSVVMKGETVDPTNRWQFIVFDTAIPGFAYNIRCQLVESYSYPPNFWVAPCDVYGQHPLHWNETYEGLILRNPASMYKFGRCTTKQNILHKMVEWERAEATVIGRQELLYAGGIPADKLGALVVKHPEFGEFNIGSGFDEVERMQYWRQPMIGRTVTFKFKRFGMKTAPRSPIFVGFREKE